MTAGGPQRILILVENCPVPLDQRVWLESRALVGAGCEVVVVCPRGRTLDSEPYVEIEGVRIHRFPWWEASGSKLGLVREYAGALWHMWRLIRRLGWFDAVQATNPPDLLFLVALPLKRRGAKLVFDHHDLSPELYRSRFGRGRDGLYWLLRLCERLTFLMADMVLSTNETYRQVALGRGRKRPDQVVVVRNAPAPERMRRMPPEPALKRGAPHLLCYLGQMDPQDGVDYALRALAHLARVIGRDDWYAVFIGKGDAVPGLRALAGRLGLGDRVTFTGLVPDETVMRYLSTADVCLSPDPSSPLNDASTMIKILEYMVMEVPVVAFDLPEARVSAGDAAVYAPPNDEAAFARLIARLLDDPRLRERMGARGRERIEGSLSWERSREALVGAYRTLLDGGRGRPDGSAGRQGV